MKKFIFCLLVTLPVIAFTQTPQFAVVRPNGTTYICPTWDSAYNKAVDGDFVYLPGVILSDNIIINKRLQIFGAGHHPDSTSATGTTKIAYATILKGASGGSLEGIEFTTCDPWFNRYSIAFGQSQDDSHVQNFSVKSCKFSCISLGSGSGSVDSLPENIYLTNNIIGSINGRNSKGHAIIRNIIENDLSSVRFSAVENNVFLISGGMPLNIVRNSFIKNNVFLASSTIASYSANASCGNSYNNNLKLAAASILNGSSDCVSTITGSIDVGSAGDIFVSYIGGAFSYTQNYNLKISCPGKNAGTDGTDVGIFGTSQPTSVGWVPSNPHIYFKQIDAQTGSDGKLRVQIKVRTNN